MRWSPRKVPLSTPGRRERIRSPEAGPTRRRSRVRDSADRSSRHRGRVAGLKACAASVRPMVVADEPDILPVMRFAPEYVTYVLNENFEDAKALFLSPLMAIHYAHLVMLADRRASSRPRTRTPCASALDGVSQDEIRDGHLRRHLRRPLLLRRAPRQPGVRRGRRGTAAHRALAQRHRHDDVPDAAARAGARRCWRRRSPCAARCSISSIAIATPSSPLHTHTQRAQPSTVAHYLLAVVEQLERDARAAARRRSRARTATRSAPARSPAPAFRSIAR